jgi:hypothetical protein
LRTGRLESPTGPEPLCGGAGPDELSAASGARYWTAGLNWPRREDREIPGSDLPNVHEGQIVDEMKIQPVLRDQCSTTDECSGGDECVGRLRCVVVMLKSIKKVVSQIDDFVRLDDDGDPVDECKPLRALGRHTESLQVLGGRSH